MHQAMSYVQTDDRTCETASSRRRRSCLCLQCKLTDICAVSIERCATRFACRGHCTTHWPAMQTHQTPDMETEDREKAITDNVRVEGAMANLTT